MIENIEKQHDTEVTITTSLNIKNTGIWDIPSVNLKLNDEMVLTMFGMMVNLLSQDGRLNYVSVVVQQAGKPYEILVRRVNGITPTEKAARVDAMLMDIMMSIGDPSDYQNLEKLMTVERDDCVDALSYAWEYLIESGFIDKNGNVIRHPGDKDI